jgi:predicted amidohydrolase
MKVRLATIQPRSGSGADEARNASEALDWLDRAAAEGADLVLFPEGSPGPVNPANRYDSLGPLAERAAEHGIHVVASRASPLRHGHSVDLHLIDDRGRTVGVHRRTTPRGPYVYRDIPAWNFDYAESDDSPQVFETRIGRIGMLVCSELYVPELSRLLMLQGADIILYPAGGAINELLPGWRTLVQARAIENLVYTAACQNLYGDEEGVATIAAPEGLLAQSAAEGMLVAELDLGRLAFLRGEEERIEFPKRYATIPGLQRWRRPELYGALAEPAHVPDEKKRIAE